jgi:hypothetical protein
MTQLGAQLFDDLAALNAEAEYIYNKQIGPALTGDLNNFPHTLCGLVVAAFSRIDLYSAYYVGNLKSPITKRMTEFMVNFMAVDEKAARVAIEMFRHRIVHTSIPRPSSDKTSGVRFLWLLQWGDDHLPRADNLALQPNGYVVNLSLLGLLDELKGGLSKYLQALSTDQPLIDNYNAVEAQLANLEFST